MTKAKETSKKLVGKVGKGAKKIGSGIKKAGSGAKKVLKGAGSLRKILGGKGRRKMKGGKIGKIIGGIAKAGLGLMGKKQVGRNVSEKIGEVFGKVSGKVGDWLSKLGSLKAVSGGAHCNPSYWGPSLSGYSGSV